MQTVNLAMCKVQNKMQKHFTDNTVSVSYWLVWHFPLPLYTAFVFSGYFYTYIKFYIFILHFILVSVIVSTGRTDKWVISGLLSVWIRTAEPRYRLCIHIPHYPHPTPDLNLLSETTHSQC